MALDKGVIHAETVQFVASMMQRLCRPNMHWRRALSVKPRVCFAVFLMRTLTSAALRNAILFIFVVMVLPKDLWSWEAQPLGTFADSPSVADGAPKWDLCHCAKMWWPDHCQHFYARAGICWHKKDLLGDLIFCQLNACDFEEEHRKPTTTVVLPYTRV